jgi:hypothetical protein
MLFNSVVNNSFYDRLNASNLLKVKEKQPNTIYQKTKEFSSGRTITVVPGYTIKLS